MSHLPPPPTPPHLNKPSVKPVTPNSLNQQQPVKKGMLFILKLAFTLLLGVFVGLVLFLGWLLLATDADQRQAFLDKFFSAPKVVTSFTGLQAPMTLLAMGVDLPSNHGSNSFEGVRTDTIMLVHLDPANDTIRLLSIPRDSRFNIAGEHGVDKVNAAFAYGGPELAKKTIEQNLGVEIDHYLVVNTQGIKDVVDALGGIDVVVDKPMRYHDYTAKLHIDLQPGKHHLDGRAAEGFLRFRHDALGDIGRISRQQQFMGAVVRQLKSPMAILSLQKLLELGKKYVLTTLDDTQLISVASFAKDIKTQDYQVATLPGHPGSIGGGSYWLVDEAKARALVNFMVFDINEQKATETTTKGTPVPPTVGLLYANSTPEQLAATKAAIEQQGFTVNCKMRNKTRQFKLVVHTLKDDAATRAKLRQAVPQLNGLQLIFSPHSSTFETNSCGETDYTVILGETVSKPPVTTTTQ